MKRFPACILFSAALALNGCILPAPHRRLHEYGVSGRVLDARWHAPINSARVAAGAAVTLTHPDGSFALEPIFGWHGGYAIGGVGVSIFPGFDVATPSRPITVSANGYQSMEVADRKTAPAGDYLQTGDILLKRR